MIEVMALDEFWAEFAQRRLKCEIIDANHEACRNNRKQPTMRNWRSLVATLGKGVAHDGSRDRLDDV